MADSLVTRLGCPAKGERDSMRPASAVRECGIAVGGDFSQEVRGAFWHRTELGNGIRREVLYD